MAMELLPELVVVTWEDAKEEGDAAWNDADAIPDYEPLLCYTTGWLLHQDARGVILTGTLQENCTARCDQIPRGMIRSITVLREAGPPR